MGRDASHYLLRPTAIATPATRDDVATLLREAVTQQQPVTFRSGGTSLSGQGVTESVLVDTRSAFGGIEVLDDGARVRVEPGAVVRQVNARLARFGRKLGPDPASEIACTIGGVIANNSSGMSCGTERNTYRTLESMVVVLASGTVIDTADPDADEQLHQRERKLWEGLAALRDRVRGDSESVERIRRLFSMKNTMGYGINAFLDHERPIDLLTRLMIGSEGTLGWVASAVFRTIPIASHVLTGLMVFSTLDRATASLPELLGSDPSTIELMDATALRVAQTLVDVPASIAGLEIDAHAALLIEVEGTSAEEVEAKRAALEATAARVGVVAAFRLTAEPKDRAALWRVRKGLYPAVAEARPSGSTALLEDIAVPVAALLPVCTALTALFERHRYENAVIFGHAKDGNIHFLLTERFDSESGVDRYARVTEEIVELVLSHGGTLKAEHGTGRMMAPFLDAQYGAELVSVMRALKMLCDPAGILNPGVIISDDPAGHLQNLKTALPVEEEVDRCVECGYCEPGCPSKSLTLTPRQRIVVRRERAAAKARGDVDLVAALDADETYESVQTCAVDGLCSIACPVSINTGDLVRRLRAENPAPGRAFWNGAAQRWDVTTRGASAALTVANAVPTPLVRSASSAARALLGTDVVPRYDAGLPRGGARRSGLLQASPAGHIAAPGAGTSAGAVFLPACVGTMFGPETGVARAPGPAGATAALLALCERAGVTLIVPEGIDGLCCGTPWKSKGHTEGARAMGARVRAALDALGDQATGLPVISDAASCTEGFAGVVGSGREDSIGARPRVIDAVTFAVETLLPRLSVLQRQGRVAVHPTCSTEALGATSALETLARAVADEAVVPEAWGCCAFAGDRGMLHPELTASATADEVADLARLQRESGPFDHAVSANRTCELGMSRATGMPYVHILELLERATRP